MRSGDCLCLKYDLLSGGERIAHGGTDVSSDQVLTTTVCDERVELSRVTSPGLVLCTWDSARSWAWPTCWGKKLFVCLFFLIEKLLIYDMA